jgi:hypothetical protein
MRRHIPKMSLRRSFGIVATRFYKDASPDGLRENCSRISRGSLFKIIKQGQGTPKTVNGRVDETTHIF